MDGTDDAIANPYESPVIKHLEQRLNEPVPRSEVACRDCPVSMWYASKSHRLTLFCPVLHEKDFDWQKDPVLFCDGREQAIAELVAKMHRS